MFGMYVGADLRQIASEATPMLPIDWVIVGGLVGIIYLFIKAADWDEARRNKNSLKKM